MSQVETTITEDEFVSSQRLNSKPSLPWRVFYWLGAAALLVMAVLGSRNAKFIAVGALVGGYIGNFVMAEVVSPRSSRKNYRRYKLIQRPRSIQLLPEGVFFKSADGESILRWENMLKWRENDELILIYVAPNLFQVIPKRLSSEGLPVKELSSSLMAKLGKAT